jgi:hypothetical protein
VVGANGRAFYFDPMIEYAASPEMSAGQPKALAMHQNVIARSSRQHVSNPRRQQTGGVMPRSPNSERRAANANRDSWDVLIVIGRTALGGFRTLSVQ